MARIFVALVIAVLWSGSVSAQYSNQDRYAQDRYARNFDRCMENQVGNARVSRREMRSIREECKHRAAARTERQARRVDRDRPVYIPERDRRVRPLERY